jgi:flagellar hook assembly protein FlgD
LPILAFIGAPLVLFDTASARTVSCASTAELNAGYANAAPGDTFLLKPGTYSPDRPGQAKAGTAQKPIVVRGESPGTVTFSTEGEGIWHYPGWWVYENIRFNANGGDHSFHIKPGADGHLAWRNCHFYNCGDKAIKVDGDFSGAAGHWTDYLLVENCTMEVGQAGLMNNDGGDFCTCRNNYTYGFVDGGVNYIYFSKGGQAYTVFENNLCVGGRRGAISLGGGSMGAAKFRHDGDLAAAYPNATIEMANSVVRNNIVIGATEGAISSSTTLDCEVYNNTAIGSGYFLWIEAHHGNPVGLKAYNNLAIGTGGIRNGGAFVAESDNKLLALAPTAVFQDFIAADPRSSDFSIKPSMAATVGTGRAPYAHADWAFHALPSKQSYDYYGRPRADPPLIGATEVYHNSEVRHIREAGHGAEVRLEVRTAPGSGSAAILVTLKRAAPLLDLLIWDAAGRHVRTLYYGPGGKGGNGFAWDGKGHQGDRMPGGNYILRASLGREVYHRRFTWMP